MRAPSRIFYVKYKEGAELGSRVRWLSTSVEDAVSFGRLATQRSVGVLRCWIGKGPRLYP